MTNENYVIIYSPLKLFQTSEFVSSVKKEDILKNV